VPASQACANDVMSHVCCPVDEVEIVSKGVALYVPPAVVQFTPDER
jgi:hypothetical protein